MAKLKIVPPYKLLVPLPVEGGEDIAVIEFKRPKARAIVDLERSRQTKDELDLAFDMIALITGLTVEQAENLDFEDFAAISKVAEDFMGGLGLQPAETPAA